MVVNPIAQEIYRESRNKYIQDKLQGIPVLFILAAFKIDNCEYQIPHFLKSSNLFITDVTPRYVEKWGKIIMFRKQLTLLKWFEELITLFDAQKFLKLSGFSFF